MSEKTNLDALILTIRSAFEAQLYSIPTNQLVSELFNRIKEDSSCILRLTDEQADLLLSRLLERYLNNGMKTKILNYVFDNISNEEIYRHIGDNVLLETAIDRNTTYEVLIALAENFKTR